MLKIRDQQKKNSSEDLEMAGLSAEHGLGRDGKAGRGTVLLKSGTSIANMETRVTQTIFTIFTSVRIQKSSLKIKIRIMSGVFS